MVTHNSINKAQCYFWSYKEENFPVEIPVPYIFTTEGSTIKVFITNALDEPHAFFIQVMANSARFVPGSTKTFSFDFFAFYDFNPDYFVVTHHQSWYTD